jgi:hypothetical protein
LKGLSYSSLYRIKPPKLVGMFILFSAMLVREILGF